MSFIFKKITFFTGVFTILFVNYNRSYAFDILSDCKEIACTITPMGKGLRQQSHPHIPVPGKAVSSGYSTNWGGYAALTNLNNPATNSVTAVYGSWIVPSIKTSKTNGYAAFWVGIDGYSSSTVEQIGTEHDCINGVVQHYAWFEMYPLSGYLITGFSMKPGDLIAASVICSDTKKGIFVMKLYNVTQKISTTVPTLYTTSVKAQRSSAEWIAEAPYLNSILPLANFGTANFSGCSATINGITASLNNTNSWINIMLKMVTSNSILKAVPSGISIGGSFSITWKHA